MTKQTTDANMEIMIRFTKSLTHFYKVMIKPEITRSKIPSAKIILIPKSSNPEMMKIPTKITAPKIKRDFSRNLNVLNQSRSHPESIKRCSWVLQP